MKRIIVVFIALMLALSGCSSRVVEKDLKEDVEIGKTMRSIKVGFSQMENNGPWRVAETNDIRNEAVERAINLIYTNAKGSHEQQLEDIAFLLEMEIDYLILAPRKFEELAEGIVMAREAGVEVILVDRLTKGQAGIDYISHISTDEVEIGRTAARLIDQAMGGNAKIVELLGTAGSSSARDRSEGFREILAESPGLKLVRSQSADFSRSEGKRVMETVIRDHGENITAVYAHNDEMAIGAIMALKAAGMEPGQDVIVVSVDGEKDALKAIVAGDLYASIEFTPYLGKEIFDVIEKHLNGEYIESEIMNESMVYDIDNAMDYIDSAY